MSLPSKSQLRFAKLSENAFPPLKGSDYAAGWDLRRLVPNNFDFQNERTRISVSSAHDYVISARGRIIAQTDIQIAVPDGCYGRVGKNCCFVQ